MKAYQLIEKLKKVNPECEVILQKDPEGNGFSPLCDIDDNCVYNSDENEVSVKELTKEMKERGYTEEDLGDGQAAVVLFPIY